MVFNLFFIMSRHIQYIRLIFPGNSDYFAVQFPGDPGSDGDAFCPAKIEERSICIDGDIGEVLAEISR